MKRSAIMVLTLALIVGAQDARGADVRSLPAKQARWALVIGVDRYDDPQISPLGGAANDARTLRDALITTAGFPADQVTLLATGEPRERLPTRINILKAVTNLTAMVPRNGLLLLAFSGHGIDRKNQAYLLPSDAYIHDDEELLAETAVRLQWIHDQIRGRRVSQVLLLLDACRNDPGGRADAPNQLSESYTDTLRFDTRNGQVDAFATLFATGLGDRAYEYTELKQGYFTWAIVDGLRGAAANEHGEVTLGHLITYVQEAVAKRVAIDIGGGRRQRPFAKIEGYRADELVLAYSPRAKSAGPAAPGSSTAGMTIDPKAIELKVWEATERLKTADAYEEYLRQYPNGTWTALARMNHEALKSAKADAAAREAAPLRVAVVATGTDASLAAAMEQEMERRLASYGGSDERAEVEIASLLRQPDISTVALGPALAKAGFNVLVLVRVENVTRDSDSISNATIRLHAYLLPANRMIGAGWTERIEYVAASMNEKARQAFVGATADLRRSIELAKTQPR